MGSVVSGLGNFVASPFKTAAGLMNPVINNSNPFEATPEEEDQQRLSQQYQQKQQDAYKKAQDQQEQLSYSAKRYQENLPAMKQMVSDQAGDQGRFALANQMKQNAAGAQSRGLLYSGIKQQADQSGAADIASQIAAQRQNANQQLEQQSRGMGDKAIQNGFGLSRLQAQASDEAYKNALAARMRTAQEYSNTAQGVGKLIGSVAGAAGGAG
jgi:hypothetical protein